MFPSPLSDHLAAILCGSVGVWESERASATGTEEQIRT